MTPPIDPGTLRPRRRWYLVAVGIAVVFTLVGVGGFVAGVSSVGRSIPHLQYILQDGQGQGAVQLEAGQKYATYVPVGTTGTCTYGKGVTAEALNGTFTVAQGGRSWRSVEGLRVATTGRYQVSCAGGVFAVGDRPQGARVAGLAGGLAALAGLPCLGFVLGGALALMVALRRAGNRRRLLAGEGSSAEGLVVIPEPGASN
jgi:hypothetical protein